MLRTTKYDYVGHIDSSQQELKVQAASLLAGPAQNGQCDFEPLSRERMLRFTRAETGTVNKPRRSLEPLLQVGAPIAF